VTAEGQSVPDENRGRAWRGMGRARDDDHRGRSSVAAWAGADCDGREETSHIRSLTFNRTGVTTRVSLSRMLRTDVTSSGPFSSSARSHDGLGQRQCAFDRKSTTIDESDLGPSESRLATSGSEARFEQSRYGSRLSGTASDQSTATFEHCQFTTCMSRRRSNQSREPLERTPLTFGDSGLALNQFEARYDEPVITSMLGEVSTEKCEVLPHWFSLSSMLSDVAMTMREVVTVE
jgi:hypothetical protein